jgi:hypothetical protein
MKTYYAVHSDKTHVQVENLEDFVARFSTKSDWKMIVTDSEGWIPHTGTECPLPDDCLCEVWVKGAKRPFALENPQKLYWSELFSYRPILTEQAEPVKEPERKCSECGNNENDLSLYCVRCLNNDGWYLTDDAQAQAVNQQLLAALQKAESHLHAMMAHIDHKPRRFQEHCWQQVLDIRAAIAAAQEQGK